ncbi:ATP-binding protein [Streptomyces sp. M19]
MHAVAELLENATVYSPSRTQVVVSIREVAAGAVVEIDDAGLGMPQDVLERAAAQLREGLDLAQLGAVPRLGLACVGRWARELGFGVELSTASAYGGARVVVFVPHRLLTEPAGGARETAAEPVVVEPTVPETAVPPAPRPRWGCRSGAVGGVPRGGGEGGQRRRWQCRHQHGRQRGSGVPAGPGETAGPGRGAWTPEAARASVASVVTGSRRGRAEAAADERAHEHGQDDREGGR